MGTRSLTFVYDHDKPIVNMYRQFDGYPHGGHGQELANLLAPLVMVNGYGANPENQVNGMGCLAALIVMHFKNTIEHYERDKNYIQGKKLNSHCGGIYLHSVDQKNCGQDYEYHIYEDKVTIIESWKGKEIFSGSWTEFLDYCSKPQKEEEEV